MSEPMEFTGERYTPECLREIRYEHVHRYVFARELVAGRRVLDAACGEGYGSALLAETASRVSGVDVSAQAVEHATERYSAANLEFHQADCLALPFPDDQFDCVVSFETLEHLENHEQLLAEFRRVLRPGGFLLVSTPDKAIYTDQQGNLNEFHVAELTAMNLTPCWNATSRCAACGGRNCCSSLRSGPCNPCPVCPFTRSQRRLFLLHLARNTRRCTCWPCVRMTRPTCRMSPMA